MEKEENTDLHLCFVVLINIPVFRLMDLYSGMLFQRHKDCVISVSVDLERLSVMCRYRDGGVSVGRENRVCKLR